MKRLSGFRKATPLSSSFTDPFDVSPIYFVVSIRGILVGLLLRLRSFKTDALNTWWPFSSSPQSAHPDSQLPKDIHLVSNGWSGCKGSSPFNDPGGPITISNKQRSIPCTLPQAYFASVAFSSTTGCEATKTSHALTISL